MKQFDLHLIPGDGIGTEVVAAGRRVLHRLELLHGGISFRFRVHDWGCERYLKKGAMMPAEGLGILADGDAILLGAVGFPGVPDHVSLRGLLLPIRQEFDQYVNLRPVRMLPGLRSPLKSASAGGIDFVVIRENTEGEYCGQGRFEKEGTEEEAAVQEARFSRRGTERIFRYAFARAADRKRPRLISATKSNALNYSMVFWDRIFEEVKERFPSVEARSVHVDALAALLVLQPQSLEVVVASNLFGDILTDLGAALLGGIGVSPSANLNPERRFPSMFEPVHGSAPDIAGKGVADPIGTFWSIVLMLEHLNLVAEGARLMAAIESVLRRGDTLTPDLGGTATTAQVTDRVVAALGEE
ncbi:MAG: tartrate dehydrogenase [Desulfobacterales bacterium]|nr:tartrate dehydrogenase [Desulfobacterales bacterium]